MVQLEYNPFAPNDNPHTDNPRVWVTEAWLTEMFALNTISPEERSKLWDEYVRIQMLASDNLNALLVRTRQERLLNHLKLYNRNTDVIPKVPRQQACEINKYWKYREDPVIKARMKELE